MQQIPLEWIDKLFNCMAQFFGTRWTSKYPECDFRISKQLWASGLVGLSYDEIKRTLLYYKMQALKNPSLKAPHQMEFYRVAKQTSPQIENTQATIKCDKAIAEHYLSEIKSKLSGKIKECA